MGRNKFTDEQLAEMSPAEMRAIIRKGEWTEPDEMASIGYFKANLAVVPADWAFELMLFCKRNPISCYATEVTEAGATSPGWIAPGADLRTDLPRYRVFKDGEVIDEPTDVIKYWRDDLVSFLIGPLPNLLYMLQSANVRYCVLGAYNSTVSAVPAGRLHGNLAISCMIFKTNQDAVRGIQIASRYPDGHGAPHHFGLNDLETMGIKDYRKPDIIPLIGEKNLQHPDMVDHGYDLRPGEVAVWSGCGVTPQLAALASKVPFMITHKAAHLLITDTRCEEFSII
jgi:uncharacterized protein YcsI (UPF0317 family)